MMFLRTFLRFIVNNAYILIGYYILINIVAFVFFLADKIKAKKDARRISEAVLLGLSFAGGSAGAMIAIYTLRHKTRKAKFRILVPLGLILHLSATAAVVYFSKI
ncbi:MAG: DUF1294 domain-containing protein [Eubacteriales bacterium]|jgi:uncharacterized membrane protein YsdA (DUF1294 family)|nr:DUF1294 domain-containing protein [Eubacteriales bacterium]